MCTVSNIRSTVLYGGIATALIVAVPTTSAYATALPSCASVGRSATQCETPGNAQIDDTRPVQYLPPSPYLGGLGVYHHGHGH